ncbi:MAG: catalase, partial [Actinobacteria bacterium]|nr:catalase [Actinomycetota bacterium]
YNFDGAMRYQHSGDQAVYAPNTEGGPKADAEKYKDVAWPTEAGEIARYAYTKHRDDDDFIQVNDFWNKALNDIDRDHMVNNIVGHASAPEVEDDMKVRVADYWRDVDPELGARVAKGLGNGG